MCTVLQLTERLLLDHAQRLPESKVQYVQWLAVPGPCLTPGCCCGPGASQNVELLVLCFPLIAELPPWLTLCVCVCRQYHRALVAVLLSRTWHVRRQAHQTVKKLLSSLGGYKLAYGLLEELKVVLSSHKVSSQWVSAQTGVCVSHLLALCLLLALTYSLMWTGFSSRRSPGMPLVTGLLHITVSMSGVCLVFPTYMEKTYLKCFGEEAVVFHVFLPF